MAHSTPYHTHYKQDGQYRKMYVNTNHSRPFLTHSVTPPPPPPIFSQLTTCTCVHSVTKQHVTVECSIPVWRLESSYQTFPYASSDQLYHLCPMLTGNCHEKILRSASQFCLSVLPLSSASQFCPSVLPH